MLINRDNLVLVAQRIDQVAEAWQMPQGGVDEGETPRQAALRELKEEIGTDRAKIIAETEEWVHYARIYKGQPSVVYCNEYGTELSANCYQCSGQSIDAMKMENFWSNIDKVPLKYSYCIWIQVVKSQFSR